MAHGLRIDVANNSLTNYAINKAAHGLARYARICQEDGLVSIVKPKILIDGIHDINTTVAFQERVVSITYQKPKECGVLLKATLLKPSTTITGVDCPKKLTSTDIDAADTVMVMNFFLMEHYPNPLGPP